LVAAEQGHGDTASLLLQQQSIRVEDTDHKGQTPFLVAAASGLMTCLNIFTDDIRVNTNHPDRSGRSALPFAAEGRTTGGMHYLTRQQKGQLPIVRPGAI
jgi:hypothetical protein